MTQGQGAPLKGQALAVPATPAEAVDGPSGFDPSRLLGLAEGCELAEGPEDEIDKEIWLAVVAGPADLQAYREGMAISEDEARWRADYMMDGQRYTASLNAAMTLVPDDHDWLVRSDGAFANVSRKDATNEVVIGGPCPSAFDQGHRYGHAATPALALCAAALKARAASVDTRPQGGDAKQAPFTSGAVGEAETPNTSHTSPIRE